MPIQTQTALEQLQKTLRSSLIEGAHLVLEKLLEVLPVQRPKHRQVLLLSARNERIVQHNINNTLAVSELDVLENQLRADLLLFIDHLVITDFQTTSPQPPSLMSGHLLYQVPDNMQIGEAHKCFIRIAHLREQLIKGLAVDDHVTFVEVAIAKVMEVEIIDPLAGEETACFNILLVSDAEQAIDQYSYTEWVFYVRPLKEGKHELLLKISVLYEVEGVERTKNLVLFRSITVTTEKVAATPIPIRRVGEAPKASMESGSVLMDTTEESNVEIPLPAPPSAPLPPAPPLVEPTIAPPTAPRQKKTYRKPSTAPASLSRWLSVAASLLLLIFAGVWFTGPNFMGNKNPDLPGPNDPSVTPPAPLDSTNESSQKDSLILE